MRRGQKMVYSSLRCSECGQVMIIPRKHHKRHKEGHIKTMYCASCEEIRDFVENNTTSMADAESI